MAKKVKKEEKKVETSKKQPQKKDVKKEERAEKKREVEKVFANLSQFERGDTQAVLETRKVLKNAKDKILDLI